MTYTNVSIDNSFEISARKKQRLMEAELAFWQNLADELTAKLENIPAAIEKYGYVDIVTRRETVRLIKEPDETDVGAISAADGAKP